MRQRYTVVVLFALVMVSGLTSFGSYKAADRLVASDMNRALALALAEQQSDVISPDTIRSFNRHLQIAELRGKATLAVDALGRQFRAYAHCPEATVFSLSDQRPASLLWMLTGFWAMFVWYRRRQSAAIVRYGGLTWQEVEGRFYAADGHAVQLTPMQQRLMEMFFRSPTHSLTKSEICEALWPKKPDASETLYTLIRRLKPVVEQCSRLKIESDRSRSYRLEIREMEN